MRDPIYEIDEMISELELGILEVDDISWLRGTGTGKSLKEQYSYAIDVLLTLRDRISAY